MMLQFILLIIIIILLVLYAFFLGYYFGNRNAENMFNPIINHLKDELKEVESISTEKLEDIDFTKINK